MKKREAKKKKKKKKVLFPICCYATVAFNFIYFLVQLFGWGPSLSWWDQANNISRVVMSAAADTADS